MKYLKRILIAGEGGQGVQVISKVLTDGAYLSGNKVSYVANYGVEQRGGVSLGFVQIANQEIGFSKFQYADILVVLADRAAPRILSCIKKDTVIMYDRDLVSEESLSNIKNRKVPVVAMSIAKEKMNVRAFNVIILGAILSLIDGVSIGNVQKALDSNLARAYVKHPEMEHFNKRALEMGISSMTHKESIYA